MISDSKVSYPSKLKVTACGRHLLIVYYDNDKRDFDRAIAWAKAHYKLSAEVQTVALPNFNR
jgi:hypothetical protein